MAQSNCGNLAEPQVSRGARQTINDDLHMLMQIPPRMGFAAARLENALFGGMLLAANGKTTEHINPVKEASAFAALAEPSFADGVDDPPAIRFWHRWIYAGPGRLFACRPFWRLVGSVNLLQWKF